jgi:hypothetical protein
MGVEDHRLGRGRSEIDADEDVDDAHAGIPARFWSSICR